MAAPPKPADAPRVDLNPSPTVGSPGSVCSDTYSTSSLAFINSQLAVHGFTKSPGLCLDGLPRDAADNVVKCLMDLLSQRMDDMSRTEDMSTKLRTLSYDHDRLNSMYRDEKARALVAEKEANLHKSRLAGVTRSLQATEQAHKHTTLELQKARTAIQSLRQTHAAELKRRDKENERMVEKWQKHADAQLKAGVAQVAGMRFMSTHANAVACNAYEGVNDGDVVLGAGKGVQEDALEEAERARKQLLEDNKALKGLVLDTVNKLSVVLHEVKHSQAPPESYSEPTPYTTTTLFPLTPSGLAHQKLTGLVSSIQDLARVTLDNGAVPSAQRNLVNEQAKADDIEEMQMAIADLRSDLREARIKAEGTNYMAKAQALFADPDEQAASPAEPAQHNVPKDTPPKELSLVVEEGEEEEGLGRTADKVGRLDTVLQSAFTANGREGEAVSTTPPEAPQPSTKPSHRALLDKIKDLRTKLTVDEPPPPPPVEKSKPAPSARSQASRPAPQRQAPPAQKAKPKITKKLGSPVKSRTSSAFKGMKSPVKSKGGSKGSKGALSSRSKPSVVELSFETEVIPVFAEEEVVDPVAETHALPVVAPKAVKPSESVTQPLIVPSKFSLPPPSPMASIPPQAPDLLPTFAGFEKGLQPPALHVNSKPQEESSSSSHSSSPPFASSDAEGPDPAGKQTAHQYVASTPVAKRLFPVAKPLAQGMIHAYSPARPSPLSRILMLSETPDSFGSRPMPEVIEEEVPDEDGRYTPPNEDEELEEDMGIYVPPPEFDSDDIIEFQSSPLAEKHTKAKSNTATSKAPRNTAAKASKPITKTTSRPERVGKEKENALPSKITSERRKSNPLLIDDLTTLNAGPKFMKPTKAATAKKGGARRVPIGSEEAASMAPVWRG